MTRLSRELTELRARSEAEIGKLKKDVEDWRGREQSASAAVQAKTDEIATLEAGLTELKRLKEEAEASLGDKLKGAEAEKTRQSERAAEAIRALETLKAETTAEAEQLRQEASQSNIAAKAAEARIQEIEAILETNKAQLESLRADLTAAREKVEALEAPASRSGEAESRARQAQQHAESLRESLAATEAREKAAKEKVQSLESELEALRASSEAEAETLRTQSAAHAERAKAETARAEAAELRVSQLETQHREQELQIAALRSDASTREQIDAELKELRASKESVAGMIREAEDRAVAAERKANGYESQLTEANGQKEEIERELETLKKDKQVVDAELAEREKKLGGLEEQLRQAGAKRRDAEQKSLGLESRVDELEKQAEVRKAELAQKTRELEEAKKKVGEVWNESQEAGKAAKARIEQLEQELAELRNISEGHEEQVRIERQNAADLQNTLEYMQEGELALKTEIDTLKGERNAANTRAQDLAQVIGRSEALLQSLEASLENQQPMGFRGPHSGFTNENPRSEPVNHYIQATALLGNAQGEVKGEAHIVAGGAQGPARLKFADGSRLVGKTTIGNGNRKTQEDSIYMARFELPNGVEVKIKAWADGMGGMGDPGTGAIASSAFLQGVHAAVTEILREGRVPTPEELYQAGNLAMQFQRSRADLNPPIKGPKGAADGSAAGGIMVTVGNEAMIVTAGDATVFHARPDGEGNYEILGYSNVDVIPVPNGSGGFAYNNVTKGFHQDMGRLYHISGLKPGDRIILGSDGLWENLLGTSYKEHGSEEARMVFQFKPPTQKIYLPLLQALRATRGRWDAADLMHDQLAIANIHHPGQKVNFLGEQIQLPATADRDNVLVMDYEHGNAPDVEVTIPVHYNPLEKVPTLEEIRAAEAAAAASTTKGLKHTAPPSTDPKVARPSDPQRVAANFYVDYYRDLAALYGANAEIPARDFVEIFFRFPEVKEVLNPSLLARAEDKQQQKGLFDAAEKKIQEKMNEDPQGAQLALQQLKKIAEVQRPVVAPDPTKVGEFLTRYQEVLVRTFGEEAAPMAAKYFETIFANFPSLEAEIGPAALAKFNPADAASKYFSSKMRFAVHPDRNRYNEKEASDTATKAVGELVALHKSNSAQEFRAANGWTTADAVENGTRTWILDPRAAFVGGKQVPPRTDPNEAPRPLLRMEHNTVSRKHFKLQFENGRWVLENLNSTYGTYVNGQQVQKQALKDGDVLRFGIFEVTFSMDPKTKSAVLQEPAEKAPILPSEPEVSGDLRSGNLTLRLTPGIPIIFGQKEIPDRRVSGQHVELMHNSRTWLIRDMGSEQGTQLNGVDIQAPVNPASRRRGPGIFKDLQNQSYVTIGGLMFRFIEFPNKTATLSYVAGDAAPPSSVSRQVTPPPSIYRLPLVQGQNYPFRSPQGDTVAEIWWEGFAQPGEGEFNLRGINGGGQVWILNQQGVGEALGSNTYALSNGASFGLGSNPAEAQWYVYNDGLITALQQRPMRSRAATEPMGGVRLNIPPTAQPRPVGRAELGGGNDISGHHLDFAVQNGVWLVRDAGTTNGTFLNGQSIGKGKGLVGDPKPLKGNDQLRTGSLILHVSLGLDGSLNLEAVDQIEPQRESPVPISPVPFSRDNGYRAPEIRGSDLLTGWLRNLRIVEARRETGLTSDTPESGNYAVNIRQPKGMFRGLLKDKELARVERLTEGRYRVYNLDFDTPMLITNERGRKLVVSKGGNEYAEIGDQLSFDGHTLVLKP